MGQDLAQLCEGSRNAVMFGPVVTDQRMGSLDDPIDAVVDIAEESGSMTVDPPCTAAMKPA